MSRSGYTGDCDDPLAYGRWQAAVKSAINGRRGQAFFREMVAALDALPVKRLEESVLVCETGCCAMGAVAIARGQDVSAVDPWDRDAVANAFGIAPAMAAEIAFENDEHASWYGKNETPEERWSRMREWAASKLNPEAKP